MPTTASIDGAPATAPVTSLASAPPGYVLSTGSVDWNTSGWADKNDTDQVRSEDGPPTRFYIDEPNRWHVWVRNLDAAIDPQAYPILRLEYRSTNTTATNSPYVLWMDDGTGPNTGGLYYVPAASLAHDGQVHTLVIDMRRRDSKGALPRGAIITLALGVGAGDKVPATFELISLTFHPPPVGKR